MVQRVKILIIEDDEVDREMARSALNASGLGAEYLSACSGAEGMKLLLSEPFDCALLDYQLAGIDGLSVLREVRKAGCQTPIIMLTGPVDEQLAVEIMKAGANDSLSKSRLSRDLLSQAVRHVVRLREAESQAQTATARGAESEQRFRTMADAAPIMLLVTDEKLSSVYLNRPWLEFTGQTAETGAGLGWADAVHPEDRARCLAACDAAGRNGARFDLEFRLRRADGEWRWVLCSGAPRLLAGGTLAGYIASCVDITERKLAEKYRAEMLAREKEARAAAEASEQRDRQLAAEMAELKDAAESANAAKDRFLSILSHELRTPLTPVLSTVQSLESEPGIGVESKSALEMIRRNVELEAQLIDDLLDLTRIGKGKLAMNVVPTNLLEAVGTVVTTARPEFEAKGLELRVDLDEAAPWVLADAARLQQVAWNLIKNALKFTPAGGSVSVRSFRGNEGAAERLFLEVRDTGIGIDADLLPRLFNAFEQGERLITRQYGGLGLGLTISKSLMQMQGGDLSVRSDGKGKGAVFTAAFTPADAPKPSSGAPPAVSAEAPKSLRVLLVDDHEDTARAMERLLRHLGHDVTLAQSVGGALKAFAAQKFDVLVSDIGLPDGSGLDLMKQLRQSHGVRGIALSGFGMDEDLRKSREAGFADHLTKPISFQRLESAMRKIATDPA